MPQPKNRIVKPALPSRPVALMLYNSFLGLYVFIIRVYALFNAKAAKWIEGRKSWQQKVAAKLVPGERRIWFHCSSVGEYEQAKPLIESLRAEYPGHKIVVTFFSPSGYEASLKSTLADHIFYLPSDTRTNAIEFVDLVRPDLAAFVKYEFWYHYLAALSAKGIPAILVSGAFRPQQPFFKWYGGLFRDMLSCFSYFFLQDQASVDALATIGITDNIVVSGDTRYDRVATIAKSITPLPLIEQFKGNDKILIVGSSWPADEQVIKDCISVLPTDWKIIFAPHEIDEHHIQKIQQLFGSDTILYSDLNTTTSGADKRILIINNIGMLSRLFAYGDIAFIGGGFYKSGIHNILEPSIFGLPVLFGPVYQKFVEAKKMVAEGIVFPVKNVAECSKLLAKLIQNPEYRLSISQSVKQFMNRNVGATDSVSHIIRDKNWLS